ncbi:MAG: DUF2130 domain-containing protein [Paramuribaculum sp.]|nr:DUF2130 domain-containing protein [Paramuribaculum sp.]
MKLQCPNCGTYFQVDRNEYAAILEQVRTAEFQAELERRLKDLDQRLKAEAKAHDMEAAQTLERQLAEKESEKSSLRLEIERLKIQIQGHEAIKKAEMADAAAQNSLALSKLAADKDNEINHLRTQLSSLSKQHELDIANERIALQDSIHAKQQTITELSSQLEAQKIAAQNSMMELNERHSAILKAKDEEIEHYKDLKSRLSTKMLGETLEQHCLNMFNRARSLGQFLSAYFEKDNDVSDGTKGDFIYRDYLNGVEYISIMFEMKNEDDKTATKHRNEDFFAKLDKDRRNKQCEYAILVSTLEADSELYNEGIVDVSYRYNKMFVIRPQFFLSVISMLTKSALQGAQQLISLRHDLEVAKAQSIDVTNFERRRDAFVENFSKLVNAHLKKQDDALTALDKAIEAAERQAENLRKIKASFEASRQKLIKANETAETDFTIKKLTRGNPTMKAKFEEARLNTPNTEQLHP